MKVDIGYTYNKPFKKLDKKEQVYSIIEEKEEGIELTINDVTMFDVFYELGNELIENKIVYGINSKYQALTLFNANLRSTRFQAIPSTLMFSDMYVITRDSYEGICHFEESTHIKKIDYYHDDLDNIFINNAIQLGRKIDKENKLELLTLNAKKQNEQILGKIKIDNNEITIILITGFSYMGNIKKVTVQANTHIQLRFKHFIDFNLAYTINRRLDTVIHLLALSYKRSKNMNFYDPKNRIYNYYNKNINNQDKRDNRNLFREREEINNNFVKLLELVTNVKNEENNAFFPFLNYDRATTSLEIQFLEYYRVLEYIYKDKQGKKGKGKDPKFMLQYLDKYSKVKNEYFNKRDNKEIEEEIRSLRNYYSHSGYYIKNLPIPTDFPKRYLNITGQIVYDIRTFVKTIAYLEIYNLAGIQIEENELLRNI